MAPPCPGAQAPRVRLTTEWPSREELLALYASVGWTRYTDSPQALERAVRQSSLMVCDRSDSGALLGLARAVSDDVSICYVQDILVRPDAQRAGVGRALLRAVLARDAHVMQPVLITDGTPGQLAFYRLLGFHDTRDLKRMPVTCFYRDTRLDLS